VNSRNSGESLIYGFRIIVIFTVGLVCGLGLAFLGTGRVTMLQALTFISIPTVVLFAALWLLHAGVRTPTRKSSQTRKEGRQGRSGGDGDDPGGTGGTLRPESAD
jgi:hypothetical protein